MEGILAAFATDVVQIPQAQWVKLAHPIQKTVGGQSVEVLVLRPDVIQCIRRRVGSDTVVYSIHDGLSVTFNLGQKGATIFLPAFWTTRGFVAPEDVTTINNGPLMISKRGNDLYLKVVDAIEKICMRPSNSDIRNAVVKREYRKNYKAMLGWQGPEETSSSSSSSAASTTRRRELPVEIAKKAAEEATEIWANENLPPKKKGGRRKTKKRTKKTLKRRL